MKPTSSSGTFSFPPLSIQSKISESALRSRYLLPISLRQDFSHVFLQGMLTCATALFHSSQFHVFVRVGQVSLTKTSWRMPHGNEYMRQRASWQLKVCECDAEWTGGWEIFWCGLSNWIWSLGTPGEAHFETCWLTIHCTISKSLFLDWRCNKPLWLWTGSTGWGACHLPRTHFLPVTRESICHKIRCKDSYV